MHWSSYPDTFIRTSLELSRSHARLEPKTECDSNICGMLYMHFNYYFTYLNPEHILVWFWCCVVHYVCREIKVPQFLLLGMIFSFIHFYFIYWSAKLAGVVLAEVVHSQNPVIVDVMEGSSRDAVEDNLPTRQPFSDKNRHTNGSRERLLANTSTTGR